MLGPLGLPEILFILVLALLIFGPKRLPEMGRMLGKGLGEFRRATDDLKRSFNTELSLDDDERRPAPRRPAQLPGRGGEKGEVTTPSAAPAPAGARPRTPMREVETSRPVAADGEEDGEPAPAAASGSADEERSARTAEPPAAG